MTGEKVKNNTEKRGFFFSKQVEKKMVEKNAEKKKKSNYKMMGKNRKNQIEGKLFC